MQAPSGLEVRPRPHLALALAMSGTQQFCKRTSDAQQDFLLCLVEHRARCREELLTNCKEATKISPIPWCFTADYNKRRACTAEEGPTRPLSWFLAAKMVGTLFLPHRRQQHVVYISPPCSYTTACIP